MSRTVRALLVGGGGALLLSWVFRLYILSLHGWTDPYLIPHLFVALSSLLVGFFLIWLGVRGKRTTRKEFSSLIASGVFLLITWLFRFGSILIDPSKDPNPRAHLRLSALFLLLGVFVIRIGVKGRRHGTN